MDRFLRLLVQEIGGIPNAPTASGPTPKREPVYAEFLRVAELFRILQSQRQVMLIRGSLSGRSATTPTESHEGVVLRFTQEALETAEYRELAERLRLEPGRAIFELVTGIGARAPQRINLVLRSVLSAMFYASHGIEVPAEDREAGRVTTTLRAGGEPFDWAKVTGTLLRVSSGRPIDHPYAVVRYRDSTSLHRRQRSRLEVDVFDAESGVGAPGRRDFLGRAGPDAADLPVAPRHR